MTIPSVMRGVVLTGNGGFQMLEVRDDVPVPAPGPQDVLIRIGAAGVNNTDINTRIGWYSKAVVEATDVGGASGIADVGNESWSGAAFRFPRIQGADAAGTIVAVGQAVDGGRIGQRVLVEPMFRSMDGLAARYFGSEVDGAFAEFACVPAAHAHAVETSLTDIELASFPCAYSTAENMLARIGLAPGERVLITGASGGVGSAAVQLASRRGARLTAIAGATKADAVRAIGADTVIERDADLIAAFGSDPFDAVVDVVGGPQFGALLECLRPGGRYAVAGAISGPVVGLDLRTLYLKDLALFGCTVLAPRIFADLIGYIERGEIRPLVAATYRLDEIITAQEEFLTKRHVGKIVLIP